MNVAPGYWNLPDITNCERIDAGAFSNSITLHATGYGSMLIHLNISIPAAEDFLHASPAAVKYESLKWGQMPELPPLGKTFEAPFLNTYVCFRGIRDGWYVAEFLGEREDCHLLVSFSSVAYEQFLSLLAEYLPPSTKS